MSYQISIIIPVYNREDYLKECLDSVVGQTIGIENIEVIIVNDNSTDNSLAILEEYAAKYPSFKIINHSENKGAGASKNTGMEHVTADYLTFLDSDDYLKEDFLEACLKDIKTNQCDLLISNWEIFPIDENSIHKPHISKDRVIDSISQKPFLVFSTSVWSKIFHKNLYKYLKFPKNSYDDNIVSVESLINSNKIFLSKNNNYFYRKNEESITKDITIKNPLDLAKSVKGLFDLCEKYPSQSSYIKLLILKFIDDILFWVYNYQWFSNEEIKIIKTLQDSIGEISRKDIDYLNNSSAFKLLYSEDILNLNNYDAETFLAKYKYYDKDSRFNSLAKLYVDVGEGFSEKNTVALKYSLDKVNNLTFDLSDFENIQKLRFDPLEDNFIQAKIINTNPEISNIDSNANNSISDEYQTFYTLDPNYILDGDFKNIQFINIQFELNILNNKQLSEILQTTNQKPVVEQKEPKGFLKKLWR